MNAIYDLLKSTKINETADALKNPAYAEKMLHPLSKMGEKDRDLYILEACQGKKVLNLGCASGDLHTHISKIASSVKGVDKSKPCDIQIDLDEAPDLLLEWLPFEPQIIVLGEIIEHLSNPGNLLKALRWFNCPILITAPNAFSTAAQHWAAKGYENVNKDHVAWYSPKTLTTLLSRYNFQPVELCWYLGKSYKAQGLIVLAQ